MKTTSANLFSVGTTLLAFVSIGFSAPIDILKEAGGYQPQIPSGSIELGLGYDEISKIDRFNPIAEGFRTSPQKGGPSYSDILTIETEEHFKKLSRLTVKASGSYGMSKGKASVTKIEESSYNKNSVYVLGYSYHTTSMEQIIGGHFTPNFQRKFSDAEFQLVRNQYGTSIINKMNRGGLIVLLYEMEAKDSKEKSTLISNVNAAIGSAKASGNYLKTTEKTFRRTAKKLKVIQAGVGSDIDIPELDIVKVVEHLRAFKSSVTDPIVWSFETAPLSGVESDVPHARFEHFEQWKGALLKLEDALSKREYWQNDQRPLILANLPLFGFTPEIMDQVSDDNKKAIDELRKIRRALTDKQPSEDQLKEQLTKFEGVGEVPILYLRPVVHLPISYAATVRGERGAGNVADNGPTLQVSGFGKDIPRLNVNAFGIFKDEKQSSSVPVPTFRTIKAEFISPPQDLDFEYSAGYSEAGRIVWSNWTPSGSYTPEKPVRIIALRVRTTGRLAPYFSAACALWDTRGAWGPHKADRQGYFEWNPESEDTDGYAGATDPKRPGMTLFSIVVLPKFPTVWPKDGFY